MKAKFLYLLEEINENFTSENFKELRKCFKDELIIEELFDENQRTKNALNSAPKEFIEFMASEFVEDLNDFPEMYFLSYEQFHTFFSNSKILEFYEIALTKTKDGDNSFYFLNGLIYLFNESPEIALFYFNEIGNYVAEYFISICYQELENFENSIIASKKFIERFNKSCEKTIENDDGEKIKMSDLNTVIFTKWNTYNDLAYCYNMIKEYSQALETYKKSLKLITLKDNFKINNNPEIKEGEYDDFTIFVNNYLLALEKKQKYKESIKVLEFVIQKYPKINFYNKQKELFNERLTNNEYVDKIIQRLIKPKKPFNLGKFEKTKLLSKEKSLEDMIIEQIKYGFQVFNKNLEIYQDNNIYGRQYYISKVNGFLDLLLIDKKTEIVYVVELKRNEAGTEVVEQTEKYIKGLKNEIKNEIRGIICLHKPKKELIELVNKKDKLELFTYSFEFNKVE